MADPDCRPTRARSTASEPKPRNSASLILFFSGRSNLAPADLPGDAARHSKSVNSDWMRGTSKHLNCSVA
jgi:hypothetical protein